MSENIIPAPSIVRPRRHGLLYVDQKAAGDIMVPTDRPVFRDLVDTSGGDVIFVAATNTDVFFEYVGGMPYRRWTGTASYPGRVVQFYQHLMFYPALDMNYRAGWTPDTQSATHEPGVEYIQHTIFGDDERWEYHPGDDGGVFHRIAAPKIVQRSGTPNSTVSKSWNDATDTDAVLFDRYTKWVMYIGGEYTAHYMQDMWGGNTDILTKRAFRALLIGIKRGDGRVITRLSTGKVLFIGTYGECLHFINYTQDGSRRMKPQTFLSNLRFEKFS